MSNNNAKSFGSSDGLSPVDGLWARMESIEANATVIISKHLQDFAEPFKNAYEAGVIVPNLKPAISPELNLQCSALFLKRALSDLRGVWVLLIRGYTSQAASVAASLHECALATICLAQSKQNVAKFLADPNGELPWQPIEMARMVVRDTGKVLSNKDYEDYWRALHAHYVWLCQIKHAAHSSVIHDTSATSIDGKGYVVMAMPNIEEADTCVKAGIALKSLLRILDCIESFAKALGFTNKLPDECHFAERVQLARKYSWEAFQPFLKSPSPISIARSRFTKKYPPSK